MNNIQSALEEVEALIGTVPTKTGSDVLTICFCISFNDTKIIKVFDQLKIFFLLFKTSQ